MKNSNNAKYKLFKCIRWFVQIFGKIKKPTNRPNLVRNSDWTQSFLLFGLIVIPTVYESVLVYVCVMCIQLNFSKNRQITYEHQHKL